MPFQNEKVPHCIVADDAFPLKPYIMKPFPFRNMDMGERVFNYRLSRARRIIENVFGICAARFRILRKPIEFVPQKVAKFVLAICTLHNILMKKSHIYANADDFDRYTNGKFVPGSWRQELVDTELLQSIRTSFAGRVSTNATDVRNIYKNYFTSEYGQVPWQYNIFNTNQNVM